MLYYTEIFSSIQGEGVNTGKPVLFIRCANCNLKCWYCDSKFTWDAEELDKKVISAPVLIEEIEKQKINYHWVFTGGEPLLQQKEIQNIIKLRVKNYVVKPYIEFETNGTIIPLEDIDFYANQYNVSIKLSNSEGKDQWNTYQRRINPEAIIFFNNSSKSNFKFVISDIKDLEEVRQLQSEFCISSKKIWLMPEGIQEEILKEKLKWLAQVCMDYGYNLSNRLHIVIWGNKRGF